MIHKAFQKYGEMASNIVERGQELLNEAEKTQADHEKKLEVIDLE